MRKSLVLLCCSRSIVNLATACQRVPLHISFPVRTGCQGRCDTGPNRCRCRMGCPLMQCSVQFSLVQSLRMAGELPIRAVGPKGYHNVST